MSALPGTNPPAHDRSVASWACAEDNTHNCTGLIPLLRSMGGPLNCDCWCHKLLREAQNPETD